MDASFSIRAAAERTGLSAHTIRAWEKRYSVLEPERTGTNRRVYSEKDIERLGCLKRAVSAGHSIGMVATLPTEDLQRLAPPEFETPVQQSEGFLRTCVESLRALDAGAFDRAMERASAVLGINAFVGVVVLPLLEEVERAYEQGEIRIRHEHLASAVLRTHLERVRLSIPAPIGSPHLVVTTPSGQVHEMGALLAALTAAQLGWQVTYLGPNMPATEIANACRQTGARAVALSLVYPEADSALSGELHKLRGDLGPDIAILVGGRAAAGYLETLHEIRAVPIYDLGSLSELLGTLADRRRHRVS